MQFFETGYEDKKITGVTFIGLTVAYDTVNHNLLLEKLYKLTEDYRLVKVVEALLRNRWFYVVLEGKE